MDLQHYILDARTATAHFPGIGRYVRNLASSLVPLLADNERLSILWNPGEATAWNPADLAGPQVATVLAPYSPFGLAQQWQMPRLLQQITQTSARSTSRFSSPAAGAVYHSPYYLMPYHPGIATVVTIHDLTPMLLPDAASLRARLLFRYATWLALRSAERIVAVSRATQNDLQSRFSVPAGRIQVIPHAADRRFCPQAAEAICQVRQKYGLLERYVLYLGINKPHKNLVRLIQAYAALPLDDSPPLVISGAWDARFPESQTQAAQLGIGERVRFLGPVADEDLPALYAGCTLFVFPSLYEGFGLPVVEAMACGAPVVCSHTSSLVEVAGDAARFFDPLQVDDIRNVLGRVLADESLRRSMRARSVRQASQFSWEQTAGKTLALYREVGEVR